MVDQLKSKPSWYELGRTLEQIGNALKDYPYSLLKDVEDDGMKSMERLEDRIRWTIHSMRGFEFKIDELENELSDKLSESYRVLRKKREEVERKLKDLPSIPAPEGFKIYQCKEIIDICERLARMDDKAWERMIRMMTVIGGNS